MKRISLFLVLLISFYFIGCKKKQGTLSIVLMPPSGDEKGELFKTLGDKKVIIQATKEAIEKGTVISSESNTRRTINFVGYGEGEWFGKASTIGVTIKEDTSLRFEYGKDGGVILLKIHLEKGSIYVKQNSLTEKENIRIEIFTKKYEAMFECSTSRCDGKDGKLGILASHNDLNLLLGSGKCISDSTYNMDYSKKGKNSCPFGDEKFQILSTDPKKDQSTPISTTQTIEIKFNQELEKSSINTNIKLTENGKDISLKLDKSSDREITITPSDGKLNFGTNYILTIGKEIKNSKNQPLGEDYVVKFETQTQEVQKKAPLVITSHTPGDREENVNVYDPVSVNFSEELKPVSNNSIRVKAENGDKEVAGNLETNGSNLKFKPKKPFQFETRYIVSIGNVQSIDGKDLRKEVLFTFFTEKDALKTQRAELESMTLIDRKDLEGAKTEEDLKNIVKRDNKLKNYILTICHKYGKLWKMKRATTCIDPSTNKKHTIPVGESFITNEGNGKDMDIVVESGERYVCNSDEILRNKDSERCKKNE
ncbi:MAG: Ig-like domain-containing protein [Leptospiraceae bacterium]|nr:Ig-like domain-containing protein [Leptospiraceae bacterium]